MPLSAPLLWASLGFASLSGCASPAEGGLRPRHFYGHGVSQDGRQAEYWLGRAANAGKVEAQSLLGIMYATGIGVPREGHALIAARGAARRPARP